MPPPVQPEKRGGQKPDRPTTPIVAGLLLAGGLLAGAVFALRPGETPGGTPISPTSIATEPLATSSTSTAGGSFVPTENTPTPTDITDTPPPPPTDTPTPVPTPTPAATATPRNTATPPNTSTPTAEPMQVNFWGIHGPVLPADQLCTEMRWDTRGVTDVRFQAGDDDKDPDPVDPVGGRSNLCFHGEITFRLYYRLPSGEERRAEYVVKHADD